MYSISRSLLLSGGLAASACSTAASLLTPGFGAVIHYESVPGAASKYAITAFSDSGARLFGVNALHPPRQLGRGGGFLTYVGASVPQWVRISWRTPISRYHTNPKTGNASSSLEAGSIIGDHIVAVAPRIPEATLRYARGGKGRAILLIFRLHDDKVQLSWSVQETVRDPDTGGTGRVYSLYGGDLDCDEPGGMIRTTRCTAGYLQDAPWYKANWEFI